MVWNRSWKMWSEVAYVHAWESFCRADFLEYSVPSAIENGFPIRSTIVDPIQAHNGLVQVEPDLLQQSQVAVLPSTAVIRLIARGCYGAMTRWRSQKATTLSPWSACAHWIRGCRRLSSPLSSYHLVWRWCRGILSGEAATQTPQNGIEASMSFIAPKGTIDSDVVGLRSPIFVSSRWVALSTDIRGITVSK